MNFFAILKALAFMGVCQAIAYAGYLSRLSSGDLSYFERGPLKLLAYWGVPIFVVILLLGWIETKIRARLKKSLRRPNQDSE